MTADPVSSEVHLYEKERKPRTVERNVTINLLVLQEPATCENASDHDIIRFENATESTFKILYTPGISAQKKIKRAGMKTKSAIVATQSFKKPKQNVYRQIKRINIGWLHCPKDGKKFTQVRATNGGGLKHLEINKDHKPKIDEFLQMAKQLFFPDKNITPYGPMNRMNFYIGNFDGEKITEFTNREGAPCDVWQFMQSRGLSPSRNNFYLLSESVETEPSELVGYQSAQMAWEVGDEESDVYIVFPYALDVKFSTGDGETKRIFNSKLECMNDAVERRLIPNETHLDGFHPTEWGYEIIEIQLGEIAYYRVDYENGRRKISYPAREEPTEHSILHQPDDMLGIHEGVLATAVITACDERCRPVFTWYADKKELVKGENLFFITLVDPGLYHCQIKCDKMMKPAKTNQLIVKNIIGK